MSGSCLVTSNPSVILKAKKVALDRLCYFAWALVKPDAGNRYAFAVDVDGRGLVAENVLGSVSRKIVHYETGIEAYEGTPPRTRAMTRGIV